MDVVHTAIWVLDVEASRSFFVDTIGLSEKRRHTRKGITNVYVGGEHGSIQLRNEPGRKVPPGERSRCDHIALSVDNINAVCNRVAASPSGEIIRAPAPIDMLNVDVAFVRSPDGYAIELVADRDQA